jgi:hypothetical protein
MGNLSGLWPGFIFVSGGFFMSCDSEHYGFRWPAFLCAAAVILGVLLSGCPEPSGGGSRTPSVSVNITVWVNGDGDILTSGENPTISASGFNGAANQFTVSVNGAYSDIQWSLNGDPISGSQGTAQSITINAADYENKNYYLGLRVSKGGVPYSTGIQFTVIN